MLSAVRQPVMAAQNETDFIVSMEGLERGICFMGLFPFFQVVPNVSDLLAILLGVEFTRPR